MTLVRNFKASIMLAFSCLAVIDCWAQAEVSSSQSLSDIARQKSEQQAAQDQSRANAQLFYQLQMLQDEMMRMRGQLEEQEHAINQLKQQRLDDYLSFDQRLTALSDQGSNSDTAPSPAATLLASTATVAASNSNEQEDYKAAFELVRQKQSEQAKAAFIAFNQQYPNSVLLPNSYYWLGRLQAQSDEHSQASASFAEILAQFPDDKRAADAAYYQALSKFQLGEQCAAKQQLLDVIERYQFDQAAAKQSLVTKAREFLRLNYP